MSPGTAGRRSGSGLRRFAAPSVAPAAAPEDRCEMCGETLPERHRHLADTEQRSIACACTACSLLFTRPGGRYRTVPDRVRHDPDAPLTAAEWAELRIPVGIAFFMTNSALGQVIASYPSSAGVTECELDLAAWDRLAATHPLMSELAPDVEALLVVANDGPNAHEHNGDGDGDTAGVETFLLPVDACYSLAGALRVNWHGFDGGAEVRRFMADFLADIRDRSRPLAPSSRPPVQPRDAGSRAGTPARSEG
jgi:Family of unknown function (DUF5947)